MSVIILSVDFVYKIWNNISYSNRSSCILYKSIPPKLFLFYEYFIELLMIVIVGIFVAVIVEDYFSRYKQFYPKNPVTAFLYASVLPVCACSVIPLLYTMDKRLSFRTLVTFIIAAPLLNPYIIVLSWTVIGSVYTILRISGAFVVAFSAGYVLDVFGGLNSNSDYKTVASCQTKQCTLMGQGIIEKSYFLFIKIFPYIIIAGILGLTFELFMPINYISQFNLFHGIKQLLAFIFIGIPVYFCNGADVLLLRPLICNGLPVGTAVAFSLTSTAICVSSFIMLLRFLGRIQTLFLTLYIMIATFGIGMIINYFLP
ncbi:permease [candidate division KSB1 bacterium]|nr:permease [candidate division KSB1 bacterium]